jgi:CheY-like chemotaxis protein
MPGVMTSESSGRSATPFGDLNVLVVEDEVIVSFLLEEMLLELGCRDVRHVTRIAEALSSIEDHWPNAAVLDVNLAGQEVFPVAERLEASRIPFIFTTGYGRDGLPSPWARRPVVQKPFRLETLGAALASAMKTT